MWTLPRYYKMLDTWKKFGPPAYMGIAGAFGIVKAKSEQGTMEDLAARFGGNGGIIG